MSKFVFQLGQISRHFYIQGVSFDFTDNGCFTVVCAVQWVKGKKQKNAYGLGLGCWRISRHFYIHLTSLITVISQWCAQCSRSKGKKQKNANSLGPGCA